MRNIKKSLRIFDFLTDTGFLFGKNKRIFCVINSKKTDNCYFLDEKIGAWSYNEMTIFFYTLEELKAWKKANKSILSEYIDKSDKNKTT